MKTSFAAQFAALFAATVADSLAALGIAYDPSKRYTLTTKYDTQDLPATAGTAIDFFDQTTSSRATHGQKEEGCNLREVGKIDTNEDFVLLGYGIEFPDLVGGSAAVAADVARAVNYGALRRLSGNDATIDRNRPFGGMGMNRGVTIEATGGGAALAYDHITHGQPGVPGGGLMLAAFERPILTSASALKATLAVNAPANMSAALTARFHMIGVSIDNKA